GSTPLVFNVELVQLLECCRALVPGDGAMLFLQPVDQFQEPVPVTLEAQRLGDIRRQAPLGSVRANLVQEILGDRDGHLLRCHTTDHAPGTRLLTTTGPRERVRWSEGRDGHGRWLS